MNGTIKRTKITLKKHGISFEEAASVFEDDESLIIADDEHSNDEKKDLFLLDSALKLIYSSFVIVTEKKIQ